MRLLQLRFTVRWMMVGVFIVAVNFALIRGTEGLTVEGSAYLAVLAYAFVPSLSLLTVAAVNAVRGLVKCGQAPPFSTGYLLLGGTASFGVCLALAPMTFTLFVSVPYCVPGHVQESSLLEDLWNYGQLIAMFALPQVVPALIGGGLAVRYRLAIVLSGRATLHEAARIVTGEV